MFLRRPAALAFLVAIAACGGSSSAPSDGPMAPTPTNPATPVSTNGCRVTYSCPATDINGNANPSTPTFNQLTLETGTGPNCRADVFRNPPRPTVPISFTVTNLPGNGTVNVGYAWSCVPSSAGGTAPTEVGCEPPAGSIGGPIFSPGPYQTMGGLTGSQSGQNITQNLVLKILMNGSTPVAACGVTVYGFVKPGG